MNIPRFHLAFPVIDLEETRNFYLGILGCSLGRESETWIDFNFFGHQIVAHLSPEDCHEIKSNKVDGDKVPSRHFGVILSWKNWESLCGKLKKNKVQFRINPKIRIKNEKGQQGTFFIDDPSGNVLEFKSFKHDLMVFEK